MLRRHTSTFASVLSLVSTLYLAGEEPTPAPAPGTVPVTTLSTTPPGTVPGQPSPVWVPAPGRGLFHRRSGYWIVPPSGPNPVVSPRLQPVPATPAVPPTTNAAGNVPAHTHTQRATPQYYLVDEPRPGVLGRFFGLRRTVAYYGPPPGGPLGPVTVNTPPVPISQPLPQPAK